jgi:hypothetical protein
MVTGEFAMNHIFISLSCFTAFTLLATACDGGDFNDALDVDEPTAQAGDALELLPDPAPAANEVWIENIQSFGSGCPDPDSTEVELGHDQKSFIILFKGLRLDNPQDLPIKTTNCVTTVQLHVPAGWRATLSNTSTRGHATLDAGLRARQTTSYFIAGDPNGYTSEASLEGPMDRAYAFISTIPPEAVVWTGCGSSSIFAVDVSLVLNAIENPTGVGVIGNRVRMALQLDWQQC